MLPASCKKGGQAAAFPDVCKTPSPGGPIPIPYPNMVQVAQASKTAKKVKIVGKPACTKKSEVPRSMGDEAGTAGGVVSSCNMGKLQYAKGSAKVKFEGKKAVYVSAPTKHNKGNAVGAQVAPSQTKVLIAP
jgi:hypothetical protein